MSIPETPTFTDAELTAAAEQLRAEQSTDEPTTRERSPRKPEDHKPSIKQPATASYAGEEYTFDRRSPGHVPNYFMMRSGDFQGFLTAVIGADGLERGIKSITDEDGFADLEDLGKLVNAIYEAVDAKNS